MPLGSLQTFALQDHGNGQAKLPDYPPARTAPSLPWRAEIATSSAAICSASASAVDRSQCRRAVGFTRYMRSEEHTSELQSLMRISYAVLCLKKKKQSQHQIQKEHGIHIY